MDEETDCQVHHARHSTSTISKSFVVSTTLNNCKSSFLLQTCWLTDDLGGLFLYMPQMGKNGQFVAEKHAFGVLWVWG